MGKRVFRGRIGVLMLTCALACGSMTTGLAAPQAPQTTTPVAYAAAPIQNFGVVSNIATRYAQLGHFKQPMDLLQRMGAGAILEQVRWDYVEQPKCGQYSWDYYDELTKEARAHNIEITGQLAYNNVQCQVGQADFNPPDPGRWKNFITALVNRYKNDIHTWEVWNEPDDSGFWTGSPQQYVALLQETYETIKGIDPAAQVSAGACSKLDYAGCDQIIAAGGQKFSDSFGFHPYVGKENFDNGLFQKLDLPHLRDHQQQSGGKPVRLTEFGWSSADPSFGGNAVGGAQGSYMVKQLVSMLGYPDLNIDRVMWYDFRDDGPTASARVPGMYTALEAPDSLEAHFGLVQSDWQTPKPSYFAYQQMAAHLAGALPMGLVDRGDGGIAYRFTRAGTVVDVVWGGGGTSLATESREAQAYDLTGQAVPTDVSGGQIHVNIGDDPVYIEHSKKAYGSSSAPSGASSSAASGGAGGPPGSGGSAAASSSANSASPSASPGTNPAPSTSNVAPSPNAVTTNISSAAATWTDPQQQLRLQYPGGWKATQLPGTAQNLLELDGPDGVLFFIDLFDQTGPPDAIVNAVKQIHVQSTIYAYADNYVLDTAVGGEPGKLLNFAYVPRDDLAGAPRTGKLWIVTHGGKEFDFQARNQSAHAGEVDAIVASVVFLR
jgi:hypothetical protein